MNQALSNYLKGMLTNEEVIEELLKMAAEIKKTEEEGNELGLNIEEKAFYDALTSPEGIRDAYSNDEFIALTKELTEQLRKNRTIDWNKKESARAKMRVLVKRLLKKYHYPPEGQEQALRTVMAQCNKWADEEDNFIERKIVSVVADRDISNLINNRLQINPETSDASIQKEVLEVYGERYPDMSLNDWRHIIEDYTPMVRKNIKDVNLEEDAKEIPLYYSKVAEDLEKPKDD
jgi:type I restriction enzyme R subunit